MPQDPVLPTRRLRPSFTHQWAGTIPPQEEAAAIRPISPTRAHKKHKNYDPNNLQTEPANSKLDPILGLAGPRSCPLAGQHNFHDTQDSKANSVRNTAPPKPTVWNEPRDLWALQPDSRKQLCLPVGTNPRILGTLIPSSGEPALVPEPLGLYNQISHDQDPLNSNQQHPQKAGPGNQLDYGPTKPTRPPTQSVNHNRRTHATPWSILLGWREGSELLGCIGLLLWKATSPKLRNVTNLPHT